MLPAQKEIKYDKSGPVTVDDPVLLSAGKMVDSIQGLRQRLQDIELDQVTNAVERLSDLRERFLTLQRSLGIVTELSACEPRVRQAQDEIARVLNPLKAMILEALSQLRRKGETNKLVAIHDVGRDSVAAADQLDITSIQSFTVIDSKPPDSEGPSQLEAEQALQPAEQEQSHANILTLTGETVAANPNGPVDAPATYSDSSFDVSPVEADNERPDFGFLKNAKSSTHEFDFSDDVLETGTTDSVDEIQKLFSSQVGGDGGENPTPTAATTDFDKKLLDDLIKNYGEFAVSPELPAAAEPANPSKKAEYPSAPRATSKPESAIDRPFLGYQNHGEFDRNLKKLIKDYGQVDLYSQHTSVKTKLRAVGAFAVLGAVLSGIYYFSAPKPSVAPSSAATQSHPSDGSESAVTGSSASIDGNSGLPGKDASQVPPEAIGASESFAVTDKQILKKNIKKGGSKQ